jgi:7-carboxy-7-deazaguanine synthase
MSNSYPIMELFYSIQGEGQYQGHAAFFIRLGGCDVGCVWCDVKESWDAAKHPSLSIEEILEEVKKSATEIVIVTGGEPLMYDCTELTKALQDAGYKTHLETSGAYALSGSWNWICVSPKKFKAPLADVLLAANELKVVVFNKSDFLWAKEHAQMVTANCQLFLQPEWSKEKEMLTAMTEYIQQHPTWKLSLQIHKYMGVR